MIEPLTGQAAELHRLMSEAANRYNRGDVPNAEQYCRRALALFADFPQALHLLGLCQWQQGDLPGATDSILAALRLRPDDAQMLHDLGNMHSAQSQWLAAAQAYLQAIELRPDHADSYTNLGAVYENLGEHDDAERAYRHALELNPRSATAAGSLAALHESGNRLEQAEHFVQIALELDSEDVVSNLTRAQLDSRDGRHGAAVERLESLLTRPLSPRNRSLALARLGAALEMLEQYDSAFDAFQASKQSLHPGQTILSGPGVYTLDAVRRIARHQESLFPGAEAASAPDEDAPVFLVGFPRSGTTLLDQMLSSHPQLTVMEERENLRDTLFEFAMSEAGLKRFAALGQEGLGRFRQLYWQRVAEDMPERKAGAIFVDKLPLNTIFMPLIACLFPGARFIFAVRDPRDVILSCFIRAFGMNEAMRNFLSLDSTVNYYAEVMQIGIDAVKRLGESVYLLRYESLIEQTENEARGLCTFLGLDWNPDMLRFQETARKRRINTPSYHQVIKPIYKSARERWRNYERYLQPVLPQLQPFIEYFGYT